MLFIKYVDALVNVSIKKYNNNRYDNDNDNDNDDSC
jgi:hypothetical protein